MNNKRFFTVFLLVSMLCLAPVFSAQSRRAQPTAEQALLEVMHSISSWDCYAWVKELASDKYEGRLTGHKGFNDSAKWLIGHLKEWGLKPGGDNATYLQAFPNPYTWILPDCSVAMHIPFKDSTIRKSYDYVDEYIPGSTSASGEVTAEVVYVGYGITAPELDYDEYSGLEVKGKIVLMEREAPVSPSNVDLFKKWRPYSFHQYKLENAVKHGAAGMLYNYGPIGNPNNSYDKNLINSHVGSAVVKDVFAGTGKDHGEVVRAIQKALKPLSFETGKVFSIKNTTEHHADGIGFNVIGILEGSDPVLKDEYIMLGGHLDHLGRCFEIMPGANDNASAVAVMMAVAEALSNSPVKPRRSIMFAFFGAEEQGVAGSKFYVENPIVPLEKTVGLINMDGVGVGTRLNALAGGNFPEFYAFIADANNRYVHRMLGGASFLNNARPRLDATWFLWADVPTLSFSAYGGGGQSPYHLPGDAIDRITPEIMEDLAQILFM
ncbi:MAG: M20/M25/M40 family metallo-hydrolase, partial [Candidatus Aminicenantes bacterium]|nr:M20/M25/M40 family metallo-hydrolase [Candidatus Aminicenantes bacterium]